MIHGKRIAADFHSAHPRQIVVPRGESIVTDLVGSLPELVRRRSFGAIGRSNDRTVRLRNRDWEPSPKKGLKA